MRRAGGDIEEQSQMLVETVTKTTTTQKFTSAMPMMHSDATKVTAQGMGLQKAFLHKQNTFTVNASQAGKHVKCFFLCIGYLLVQEINICNCFFANYLHARGVYNFNKD